MGLRTVQAQACPLSQIDFPTAFVSLDATPVDGQPIPCALLPASMSPLLSLFGSPPWSLDPAFSFVCRVPALHMAASVPWVGFGVTVHKSRGKQILLLQDLDPTGPGAQCGLQEEDELLSFGGTRTTSMANYKKAFKAHAVIGSSIQVCIPPASQCICAVGFAYVYQQVDTGTERRACVCGGPSNRYAERVPVLETMTVVPAYTKQGRLSPLAPKMSYACLHLSHTAMVCMFSIWIFSILGVAVAMCMLVLRCHPILACPRLSPEIVAPVPNNSYACPRLA